MTPVVWVALGVVLLVGLFTYSDKQRSPRTLDFLNVEKPIIIRSSDATHHFPYLGISVTLPDGWSYLSVTDDAVAERPSFVQEATRSIIRLQRFGVETWPPADTEVETTPLAKGSVEWVQVDHRRLGKLSLGNLSLALIVITHTRGAELNQSIDEFCRGIRRFKPVK